MLVVYLMMCLYRLHQRIARLESTATRLSDRFRRPEVPWTGLQDVLEHESLLYIRAARLPGGVAVTQALTENFFATVVCIQTHIPLLIVGSPGKDSLLPRWGSFLCYCTHARKCYRPPDGPPPPFSRGMDASCRCIASLGSMTPTCASQTEEFIAVHGACAVTSA